MRQKLIAWYLIVAMLVASLSVAIGETDTAQAAGGTNLTLGKTVTASGYNQTYTQNNVKDGNPSTYWESANNAFPQWIQVDLGAATSIDQIVLKLPAGWGTRTQTITVQGSANGSTFTDIVGSAGYVFNPAVANNSVTINFAAASTRYVRLSVSANTGWPAAQLSEVEIYGADTTLPPPPPEGTYEAEAAALSGGAKTNTDHTGYSGSGFVDGYWIQGAATTFAVNVSAAGSYDVALKYGNASGSAKTVSLYVNGTKIRQTSLPNLANWDTWGNKVETLSLNAGNNTIAYKYDANDSGNVNLDLIAVAPATTTNPPPAGNNIALGKPISASSSTQNYVAANANDNDVNTYWEGGGSPSQLTIDLQADYNVTSIVLKLNPASVWSTRTQTIQVLGHNQSTTTFGNLVSSQTYTFNPATGNSVTIPVTATVKRLQLNIASNSGALAGQLAEFQVFGTAAANPDLTVTGMSWTPASPMESSAITLSATVANNGTASSSPTTVNFIINNQSAGFAQVNALTAGASATVSLNVGTKDAGTYSVGANVDENNAVIELNEANNGYTHPVSLVVSSVPSSDLVGATTWSPSTPVAGNAVSFNVSLKNQGTVASASGAHGVTVVVKNSGGTTLQTLNGSYSGVIAAGQTVNVSVPGSWTAANGAYSVTTTVAVDANEIAAKQANNVGTSNLMVYALRGASVPYSRYDTQDGTLGGGATLQSAPTFNQTLTASEASGQSYAALPSGGSSIGWTVRPGQGGAGVTMRFTMPDSSNGMGMNGSLDVYVNNVKVKTVSLTSYYSWQYFSGDMPADAPGGGRPLFRFDEVHWKLDTPLQPGDVIKIQKGNDGIEYGVDFIEIEPVPTAIPKPTGAVSVTDYGAVANDGQDDLAAFNAAVSAAASGGKTLYIPEGTFHLGNMWQIGSVANKIGNLTVTGAGFWYTNIQFTNANASGGGISLRISGKLDFGNLYMNSNLRSRYGQNAVYKGFMDNFGVNSVIHDVWVEHFECGFWVGDYAHTPAIAATGLVIENSRIRNNLADGVNFAQGTSNSTVRNTNLRNNGDDALAVWPDSTNNAPMGVNNIFSFNTIENNWRAGGIAFFGGSGHQADHNYIIDCVGGSGIRMNTVFPGYHFENNAGIIFSDNTIVNCGTSQDLYNGERGAIDLEASTTSIKNVTFTNIDIINSQRDAIQFGYSGGFQNIVFNNININGTGLDGVTTSRFSGPHLGSAIYSYTNNGSATFNGLTTNNVAYPNLNYLLQGFNLTINP